jgi:hypothetical protein
MKGWLTLLHRAFLQERPLRPREAALHGSDVCEAATGSAGVEAGGSRSAEEKFAARRLVMMVAAGLEGLLRTRLLEVMELLTARHHAPCLALHHCMEIAPSGLASTPRVRWRGPASSC